VGAHGTCRKSPPRYGDGVDMSDSSDIPPAAEPFLMGLDAESTFAPVMNVDEMRAGVGRGMASS
jgi:hypothetical protein